MAKSESNLMQIEFLRINSYLTSFNLEVLSATSDRRKDVEIAHDFGVEYKGDLNTFFAQVERFLKIRPWPWWEIRNFTNRRLSNEYKARRWFEKMLLITRTAYDDPNAKPTGKAPPEPERTPEQRQLAADLGRVTRALVHDPQNQAEHERELKSVIDKMFGVDEAEE
ncbi:MAG: hypothetical protein P4L33_06180 [Capsulimonadaceae bacterium]|nr:hypothetical protein [Capsulimonadaceae bacterium]